MATPSAFDRQALKDLSGIFLAARGDHPALADVRARTVAEIDRLTRSLELAGVDVETLQTEIDAELEVELAAAQANQ